MNVLQRRMFQAGGPSDKLIQTEPVNSELVRYYVQQGYSPLEIQEVYPIASLGLIEQIAKEEGRSLNPAVSMGESMGSPITGGPIVTRAQRANVIPETISTPLGDLSFEQIPDPDLPKPEDINVIPPAIQNYILNAGTVLDRDNLVRGLGVSFNLSSADANQAIDIVTGSTVPETTKPETPDLLSIDDVMTGEQAKVASTVLRPNQYRASDGTVHNIDPVTFADRIRNENSRVLQGYIYNPYVEYGSTLKKIIEDEAYQRQSTISGAATSIDEARNKNPQALNFGGAFQSILEGAKDIGLEGTEKILDFSRAALPGLAGIFQGRREELAARKKLGQPFEIETGLGDPAYTRLGGETKENLDQFILESSTGQVEQAAEDEIAKGIDDLEKQAQAEKDKTQQDGAAAQAAAEDEADDDGETATETETDTGTPTDTETKKDAKGDVAPADSSPEAIGGVFNSPGFIDYVASLSKGLSQAEDTASGLALGSAIAAEQRQISDLEKKKLDQEFLLKQVDSGKLDFKDAKDIYSLNNTANLAAQSFQNSTETLALIKELENVLTNEDPTSLTSFAEDIFEKAMTALGKSKTGSIEDFKNLSASAQARKLSTLISQANIREILGESGRTISNFDRKIVEQLSTSIVLGEEPALNLKALSNVEGRIRNNMQTQIDEINAVRQALKLAGQDLIGKNAFKVIQDSISLAQETGVELGTEVIDFRDQFKT